MASLKNKKVLLIGGAGFIGKQLAHACDVADMKVIILDTCEPVAFVKNDNIEFIEGDYRDVARLAEIVDNLDYVVHLAHDTILLDVACDMKVEIERNILPAIKLMEICSASNISKLLFVSSGGTVYGNPELFEPVTENNSTHPVSVYGATKLMIENLGFLYYLQRGLPFLVVRPANAYGQGQRPFLGQGFVATAFASAKLGQPISIFGDGSVVRDYIHVTDIANAMVALLAHGNVGNAYNVGTSAGMSLRALIDDYIKPIVTSEGYDLVCDYEPQRKADVVYNVLSNAKLLSDTGFVPKIDLANGLKMTWDWVKTNEFDKEKSQ